MSRRLAGIITLAAWALWATGNAAEAPRVVVTILPVHSLVAGVMAGIGTPDLLIEGAGSPHGYAMRPSQARALHRADLVFWIGGELESFLRRPLKALPAGARIVTLHEARGVLPLRFRKGDLETADDGRAHGDRAPGATDMHLWLDPANARAMVGEIVRRLSAFDPANAQGYRANGSDLERRLGALDRALEAELAPLRGRPYVVFHDAYQYLERRYGLRPAAAITVDPERRPGAKTLAAVRRTILATGAACVFSEPQFRPAVIAALVAGTEARIAILDPMGAGLAPGPEAYFTLMRDLAGALGRCLEPTR